MRLLAPTTTTLAASLLLAACGGSSNPVIADAARSNGVLPAGAVPTTRYDLANGCYALKSQPLNRYATVASGGYNASAAAVAGAEAFFMKPTALGKYLFYTKDGAFLAVNGSAVGSASAPSDATDWTIDTADAGRNFSVFSAAAGKALAVDPASGQLLLADPASAGSAAQFAFSAAQNCNDYPEVTLNASGDTFKGQGIDQPVLGFADVHQHVSATTFLGGAHYGAPFHRFGVTEALKNCEVAHGPDGHKDLLGNLYATQPLATHNTVGWPTFIDWPAAHSLTHESTYYKWIERAWKAGLRIMVNNLVENQTLCRLEIVANGNPAQNCNEMDSAVSQVQFMHDLQDYVDAQQGGPGKGWFRLVDNPADARRVINEGKLAVVLGIEISHLFNCTVTQPAGLAEVSGCTTADIDTQFDRLYKLGVRQMFPVHEFDNALGGNGIFDGLVLNVGNFADTGKFWATYQCPSSDNSGQFNDYLYTPGAIMTTSDPSGSTNPVVSALLAGSPVTLPIYPNTRQCNARGLTDLGKYAFKKMMDNKIIMEVDHLELSIKEDLIKLAEQQVPQYPLISSHGGHGGISNDQAQRIYALGGVIYPGGGGGNGAQFYDFERRLLPLHEALPNGATHLFGVGIGSDTNGLAAQPGPSGAKTPVQYPFTLFSGKDWGPQFARIAPISFDHQVSGQRVYDINVDGRAHYGLDADWVEEVRLGAISEAKKWNADPAHQAQQLDPDQQAQFALTALYNSAEAYLRLWEATVNR